MQNHGKMKHNLSLGHNLDLLMKFSKRNFLFHIYEHCFYKLSSCYVTFLDSILGREKNIFILTLVTYMLIPPYSLACPSSRLCMSCTEGRNEHKLQFFTVLNLQFPTSSPFSSSRVSCGLVRA